MEEMKLYRHGKWADGILTGTRIHGDKNHDR